MDHSCHQTPGPLHQDVPHRILPQTAERRLTRQAQVPPNRVKLTAPIVALEVR